MNKPIHGGNLAWAESIANCPAVAILDFSASINPLGPPQSAILAINKGISEVNHYPDPNYAQFCQTIAIYHDIQEDSVLPGNGAAELLTWAGLELSQLEVTFIPNPGFADYQRALNTFSVPIQPYNIDLIKNGLKTKKKGRNYY